MSFKYNNDTGKFDVEFDHTSVDKPNGELWPGGTQGEIQGFHQSGIFRIPEHSRNDISSKKKVTIKNLHYGGTAWTGFNYSAFFWNDALDRDALYFTNRTTNKIASDQKYEYGKVPPEALTINNPLVSFSHNKLDDCNIKEVNWAGSTSDIVSEIVQPFKSFTVIA